MINMGPNMKLLNDKVTILTDGKKILIDYWSPDVAKTIYHGLQLTTITIKG